MYIIPLNNDSFMAHASLIVCALPARNVILHPSRIVSLIFSWRPRLHPITAQQPKLPQKDSTAIARRPWRHAYATDYVA